MVGRGAVKAFTRASIIALLVVLAHSSSAPATVASDLCPSGQDPCEVNTAITVDPGSVIDLGGRGLQLDAAARVTLGAGAVQILAGSVRLRPGARITGATGAAPSSLEIDTTGDIALEASGSTLSRIDLSAAPARAVRITLKAGGAITVAGIILSDGPSTEASGWEHLARRSAAGDLVVSGTLSANGGSDGTGGFISVEADGGKIDLAQPVDISGGEFGAGELDLTASGDVIVRQAINASGGGLSGDGGTVFISAGGTATLLANIDGTAAGSTAEGGGDRRRRRDRRQPGRRGERADRCHQRIPGRGRRDVLLHGRGQLHADAEDHAPRERRRRAAAARWTSVRAATSPSCRSRPAADRAAAATSPRKGSARSPPAHRSTPTEAPVTVAATEAPSTSRAATW